MILELFLSISLSAVLLGLPLVTAGVLLLWSAVSVIRQSRRAAAWPVHHATVLTSGSSTIGLYRTFPSGGVARRLDLRYAWLIDGHRFEGSRVRFTIWRLGGQSAATTESALAGLVPGASIEIRVDPTNPREAVVDPAVDQAAVLTALLVGPLFFGYGSWLLLTGSGLIG